MRGLREQLVKRLEGAGVIADPVIARAFRTVPRHRFVPEVTEEQAYTDQVVPTKRDSGDRPISSASQPSMVALMLRQLAVRPGHRVLEIGAGTGYNAALLAELVGPSGSVTTVDLDAETVQRASTALARNGYRSVRVRQGDGGHGVEEFAPYDRIVVTAGSTDLPPAWWRQLTDGGLLVVPLTLSGIDASIAFRKRGGTDPADERLVSESVLGCAFMPMRGGFAARRGTVDLAGQGVRAVFEGDRTVDVAGLRAATEDPTTARSAEVSARVGELIRGLDLWLAVTEPAFCLIELNADAVRTGVLRALLTSPGREGRVGALLRGDSFAALDYSRASVADAEPADPWDNPAEGLDARVDLRVIGYGPDGPELCDRLTAAVQEWRRRDICGPERMRVQALPAGTPIATEEDAHIIDKPYCRLVIRWR